MTKRNMQFFMKGNAKAIEEMEEVVSDRYLDEEGKPIPFVFRATTSERIEELRDECTKRLPAKKGRPAEEKFDSRRFMILMGIESTVYPNFKAKELLDSYGLVDPVALVSAVLAVPGEVTAWMEAVQSVNKLNEEFDELVEDAKN